MQTAKPKNNNKEDWINRKWRPLMAVTYIAICVFDFIVGPLVNYWFFSKTGITFNSWKPLTMSDGGMFHISMGAILGVAAYTRGQEKVTRNDYSRYSRRDASYDEPYDDSVDYTDRSR